jgi:hypothetical protein
LRRVLVGLDEGCGWRGALGARCSASRFGVVLAKVVLGDGDVLLHRIEIEDDVLDRRLLGRWNSRGMRRILVVRLDLGIGRRALASWSLASKRSTWTSRCWYIASSAAERTADRRDRRVAQRLQHLAAREVLAQALGERLGRHAERRRGSRLTLPSGLRSAAYSGSLLKARSRRSSVMRQVQLVGGDQRQAVADHAVERHGRISGVSNIFASRLGIWRRARSTARASRCRTPIWRDRLAGDRRDRLLVVAGEAGCSPGCRRRRTTGRSAAPERNCSARGVTAKEIEHGVPEAERRTAVRLSSKRPEF